MTQEDADSAFGWNTPPDFDAVDVLRNLKDVDSTGVKWEGPNGDVGTRSYQTVWEETCRFGNCLQDLGVERSDRVLVLVSAGPDVYAVRFGTWMVGGIVVPGNVTWQTNDLTYIVRNTEPAVVVADDPELADKVDGLPVDKSIEHRFLLDGTRSGWYTYRDQLAGSTAADTGVSNRTDSIQTITYTSGTTGRPKGIVINHSRIFGFDRVKRPYWWNVSGDDRCWSTVDPWWAKWSGSVEGSILTSGASSFHYTGSFDPDTWFELLNRHDITQAFMAATELRAMIDETDGDGYDLPSLHTIVTAGEALSPYVYRTFRDAYDVEVREGYAQTEAGPMIANTAEMAVKPGSVGKPLPGVEIEYLDEAGEPVEQGEVGEITIVSDNPFIFAGYWGTADTEGPDEPFDFAEEGYRTGDLASVDDDGYVWFEGRSDDVIISSGYRIGPHEIEAVLDRHSAVNESAVVGSPDPIRGSIVKAFVVTDEAGGEDLEAELQGFVKSETAPYKYPREVEFVSEIPTNSNGKIDRKRLRDAERQRKAEVIESLEGGQDTD